MIKAYGEAEPHATVTSFLWEQQPALTGFVAGWASELVWLSGEEKIILSSPGIDVQPSAWSQQC
jgi:hypothetical protein